MSHLEVSSVIQVQPRAVDNAAAHNNTMPTEDAQRSVFQQHGTETSTSTQETSHVINIPNEVGTKQRKAHDRKPKPLRMDKVNETKPSQDTLATEIYIPIVKSYDVDAHEMDVKIHRRWICQCGTCVPAFCNGGRNEKLSNLTLASTSCMSRCCSHLGIFRRVDGYYIGQTRAHAPHGFGASFRGRRTTNGMFYMGDWREGYQWGRALVMLRDGSFYVGPFQQNRPHTRNAPPMSRTTTEGTIARSPRGQMKSTSSRSPRAAFISPRSFANDTHTGVAKFPHQVSFQISPRDKHSNSEHATGNHLIDPSQLESIRPAWNYHATNFGADGRYVRSACYKYGVLASATLIELDDAAGLILRVPAYAVTTIPEIMRHTFMLRYTHRKCLSTSTQSTDRVEDLLQEAMDDIDKNDQVTNATVSSETNSKNSLHSHAEVSQNPKEMSHTNNNGRATVQNQSFHQETTDIELVQTDDILNTQTQTTDAHATHSYVYFERPCFSIDSDVHSSYQSSIYKLIKMTLILCIPSLLCIAGTAADILVLNKYDLFNDVALLLKYPQTLLLGLALSVVISVLELGRSRNLALGGKWLFVFHVLGMGGLFWCIKLMFWYFKLKRFSRQQITEENETHNPHSSNQFSNSGFSTQDTSTHTTKTQDTPIHTTKIQDTPTHTTKAQPKSPELQQHSPGIDMHETCRSANTLLKPINPSTQWNGIAALRAFSNANRQMIGRARHAQLNSAHGTEFQGTNSSVNNSPHDPNHAHTNIIDQTLDDDTMQPVEEEGESSESDNETVGKSKKMLPHRNEVVSQSKRGVLTPASSRSTSSRPTSSRPGSSRPTSFTFESVNPTSFRSPNESFRPTTTSYYPSFGSFRQHTGSFRPQTGSLRRDRKHDLYKMYLQNQAAFNTVQEHERPFSHIWTDDYVVYKTSFSRAQLLDGAKAPYTRTGMNYAILVRMVTHSGWSCILYGTGLLYSWNQYALTNEIDSAVIAIQCAIFLLHFFAIVWCFAAIDIGTLQQRIVTFAKTQRRRALLYVQNQIHQKLSNTDSSTNATDAISTEASDLENSNPPTSSNRDGNGNRNRNGNRNKNGNGNGLLDIRKSKLVKQELSNFKTIRDEMPFATICTYRWFELASRIYIVALLFVLLGKYIFLPMAIYYILTLLPFAIWATPLISRFRLATWIQQYLIVQHAQRLLRRARTQAHVHPWQLGNAVNLRHFMGRCTAICSSACFASTYLAFLRLFVPPTFVLSLFGRPANDWGLSKPMQSHLKSPHHRYPCGKFTFFRLVEDIISLLLIFGMFYFVSDKNGQRSYDFSLAQQLSELSYVKQNSFGIGFSAMTRHIVVYIATGVIVFKWIIYSIYVRFTNSIVAQANTFGMERAQIFLQANHRNQEAETLSMFMHRLGVVSNPKS